MKHGWAWWRVGLAGLLIAALALASTLATNAAATPVTARAAAGPPDASTYRAIDGHIERQMRELRIPGVALAIVHGDQIAHARGFGVLGPDGRPVTATTPFQIASVLKPMTGVAVMQLAEAGNLDLDAPVRRYIPWFRVADEAASAQITPRHLLYHTSGLPQAVGVEYALGGDARPDAIEARVRELRTVRLSRPVGAAYEYSNAGYAVLGLLIQTVSGQPYAEYMREHVFAPLQMHGASLDWEEARRRGAATGYRFWFGAPQPERLAIDRGLAPAGSGASASAEDVAHFVIAQLNGGRFGDTAVLSPEGVAAMQRPTLAAAAGDSFAMDWSVSRVGGTAAVIKGGSLADFKSQIVLLPELRLGLVVLINTNRQFDAALGDARLPMLAYNVAELLLGQPPTVLAASLAPTLIYAAIFVVVSAQVAGMVRAVALLRRRRHQPSPELHGRAAAVRWRWLPPIVSLLWGLFALIGIPALFGAPLSYCVYMAPDLFTVLIISGGVALLWTALHAALIWPLPRRPAATAASPAQPAQKGALQ